MRGISDATLLFYYLILLIPLKIIVPILKGCFSYCFEEISAQERAV